MTIAPSADVAQDFSPAWVRRTVASDTPCRSNRRPRRHSDRTPRPRGRGRRAPARARRHHRPRRQPVSPLDPRERFHDVQIAVRIEGDPLRPPEAGVANRDRAVAIDSEHRIVRRQRRRGDVQRAVRAEREMERRHARRHRRDASSPAPRDRRGRSCPSDRRQTACRRDRTPGRMATPRSVANGSTDAVGLHPIHRALEPARHVEIRRPARAPSKSD